MIAARRNADWRLDSAGRDAPIPYRGAEVLAAQEIRL